MLSNLSECCELPKDRFFQLEKTIVLRVAGWKKGTATSTAADFNSQRFLSLVSCGRALLFLTRNA
jgi:hypothetical protein